MTFAVWLRGRGSTADVVPFWIAQIVGAFAAGSLAIYLKDNPRVTPQEIKVGHAFVAELVGTFALVYAVLNVAIAKAKTGNSNYGLAIGFTVRQVTGAGKGAGFARWH